MVFPNEVWFEAPADPELRQTTIETLSRRPFQFIQFVDMRQMLAEEGSDPLTAAGGSGILLVAFIAVGALIGLAFLVTIYITAQRRTVEMAVMRTLGLSGRQILTQMAVEYLTVVAIGLVVGTYLGTLITRLMLSFLEVTEFGRAGAAALHHRYRSDGDRGVVRGAGGGLRAGGDGRVALLRGAGAESGSAAFRVAIP